MSTSKNLGSRTPSAGEERDCDERTMEWGLTHSTSADHHQRKAIAPGPLPSAPMLQRAIQRRLEVDAAGVAREMQKVMLLTTKPVFSFDDNAGFRDRVLKCLERGDGLLRRYRMKIRNISWYHLADL